jgi:uncharacterized protein YktA (UPF0223 family)
MLEKILERYISQYGDNKESRIVSYKEFLKETDYCIIKMYETVVQGGSIIEMLKNYKEVLNKRKEVRQLINELEGEAQNGN